MVRRRGIIGEGDGKCNDGPLDGGDGILDGILGDVTGDPNLKGDEFESELSIYQSICGY